jgi:hypothetical protein
MEPYPIKPTMPTSAGAEGGGEDSPTMPEGERSMKINVYEVLNLVSAVECRTSANDPPIDAHDCIHTCTPICTSTKIFLVSLCSLVDE